MTISIGGSDLSSEPISVIRVPEEIKRTQQILIFLISILLTIHVIIFIVVIYSLSINYRTNTFEPIINLCWILFFAIGLFVTQRYYVMGLFIFAWLGILNIVLTCMLIVFVTVAIVIITSQSSKLNNGIPFTIIPIVACLTSVILDAIVVIFSFKLWYLIIKNQRPTNPHHV
ncbi:unnamed protein product [Adineta ricciae]|uniref:Uncharacterized protein n=1 Tax=Adineta ricciae TaxID=249248 RepID=A0A814LLJ0_ADIRI|nr:unnamed protein product [Adineta ricciae]CAF1067862.1 unnamed protein product [Adineta ricciae]